MAVVLAILFSTSVFAGDERGWYNSRKAACMEEAVTLFKGAVKDHADDVVKYICNRYTYKYPCKIQKFMIDYELMELFKVCMNRREA